MRCPKCSGDNVTIQMAEVGSRTSRRGNGLAGNTYNAARGLIAVSTLGVSNLFMPKAKGHNKTKNKLEKFAICQECGHSWTVK
ncbi:MAG: hypothetical protein J5752_05405 [Clostridiales bacterium]|nr:hypothetical protein [Clostridiales bacterium]